MAMTFSCSPLENLNQSRFANVKHLAQSGKEGHFLLTQAPEKWLPRLLLLLRVQAGLPHFTTTVKTRACILPGRTHTCNSTALHQSIPKTYKNEHAHLRTCNCFWNLDHTPDKAQDTGRSYTLSSLLTFHVQLVIHLKMNKSYTALGSQIGNMLLLSLLPELPGAHLPLQGQRLPSHYHGAQLKTVKTEQNLIPEHCRRWIKLLRYNRNNRFHVQTLTCKLSWIYKSSPQGYTELISHINSCETKCHEPANCTFSAVSLVWNKTFLLVIPIAFSCLNLSSVRDGILVDLTSLSPSTLTQACEDPAVPLVLPTQRPHPRSGLRCL